MAATLSRFVSRVPALIWAALLTAAIIGGMQWCNGGRKRVPVVGAGPVSAVQEDDAPALARYDLDTRTREPLMQSATRIEQAIGGFPDAIVIGLDPNAGSDEAQVALLTRLAKQAENAAAAPVVVGPPAASLEVRKRFRAMCDVGSLRLCVDITDIAGDSAAVREAVARAVDDVLAGRQPLRLATQPAHMQPRP